MTLERCPNCEGEGTRCVTCGKGRPLKRSYRAVEAPHRACKQRPHGVVPCPLHAVDLVRCDHCGVKAPCVDWTVPAQWAISWVGSDTPRHQMHACGPCSQQLAVARDAVGGMDLGAVGQQAADNVTAALDRMDLAKLDAGRLANLTGALRRTLARLQRPDLPAA